MVWLVSLFLLVAPFPNHWKGIWNIILPLFIFLATSVSFWSLWDGNALAWC